ncbi:hypothetical protein C4565_05335 [Candidatus Parcubacteria bacterium]|nr:MAG: hypothetical protein C4565_05335 [Candidatus Parcubacteria bacterium]
MRIRNTAYALKEFFTPDLNVRYEDWGTQFLNAFRNIRRPVRRISLKEAKRNRNEILFILGCNRSINELKKEIWQRISRHDTLGFNYWIYHPFVPTYYGLEYDRNYFINHHHAKIIQARAKDYAETIFLVHSRAWRRGMSPRLLPQFFPENPKVLRFLFPPVVNCPDGRPFNKNDFRNTILYRGSLNLYLHFARLIGYKKIVFVGCEMNVATAFYEDYPEAQWMFQVENYLQDKVTRSKIAYGGVENSKGRHSMPTAIKAINEFVFKPEGISLYVLDKRSVLYPDVPVYTF